MDFSYLNLEAIAFSDLEPFLISILIGLSSGLSGSGTSWR